MKIKTVKDWKNVDDEMNSALEELINEGFMIIDYGLMPMVDKNDTQIGYIKYCDKQFLRDYKIKSIMNEI